MITVRHFIGGEWADSADGAAYAARRAFDHGPWPRMNPAARKKIMHTAAALIEERLEEFAAAETRDMGKPIRESRTNDVPRAAYNLRFFADFAEHTHTETYA